MNQRIQELFERAGGKTSIHNLMSNPVQHREYNELWDENITKFAELIVRECADVAGCNGHVSGFALGDLIKQHFGVKL